MSIRANCENASIFSRLQFRRLTNLIRNPRLHKQTRPSSPKDLGFQLANTWPKITARDLYATVKNGEEPENLNFSSVAATLEKASTYVFAERLIRNAQTRRLSPLPPVCIVAGAGGRRSFKMAAFTGIDGFLLGPIIPVNY